MSTILPLDNKYIYNECSSFAQAQPAVHGHCLFLNIIGFIGGILFYPTAAFITIFGCMLLVVLCKGVVWHVRQEMYGITLWICHLLFFIVVGGLYIFACRGLPWTDFDGYCLHTTSIKSCRISHFLETFIISFLANTLFLATMNQAVHLRFSGQIPPFASFGSIIAGFFTAIAFAVPDLHVTGLFLLDGRLYCGTRANLTKSIILAAELHRSLFGYGIVQCSFSLICVAEISVKLQCLGNSIRHIYTSILPNSELANVTDELCEVLRNIRRGSRLVLLHSSIMSTLLIIRAVTCVSISFHIYQNKNSLPPTLFRCYLFSRICARDCLSYLIIVASGYQFWMYYYYLPAIRVYLTPISKNSSAYRNVYSITPVNPNPWALEQRFLQLLLFIRKFDRSLYEQLYPLRQPIFHLADYRLDRLERLNHIKPFETAGQGETDNLVKQPISRRNISGH